ncbi:gluconokinase [Pseudohongiella spirulinae]|uniref:Gluconokinase n=1 Tax=Pseudohongiella spirulinae TaxID=1249552 RepID=A0A0S2KG20_9GAMM|nr:hypothetical protein [Pseudohongiella spirulinae]ALO47280.1 hypothetical protein PS2015_2648 [Pseudohongiella spirulinae]
MEDQKGNNSTTSAWLLFGLSGSGKNYVADVLASHYGWPVYHADDDITPAMRRALAEARPFTEQMRDEFFQLLADKINARLQAAQDGSTPTGPLLVTQGVYKNRHRHYLQSRIPGLRLLWIDALPQVIDRRLESRCEGISADSARALVKDFEAPAVACARLQNNSDAENIISQFRAIVS